MTRRIQAEARVRAAFAQAASGIGRRMEFSRALQAEQSASRVASRTLSGAGCRVRKLRRGQ